MLYNLSKEGKWVFNRRVNDVHLYEGGVPAGVAGYLGKSAIVIKAVPRTTDLIDGSKYQLGFDISYEVVSEQLYSVFEFEKLMNKSGYIYIPDIPLWIGTTAGGQITFNIEVDINPGETKGQVKLSGSKFVSKLTDGIAQNWNGAVASPFATPLVYKESSSPLDDSVFEYEYLLNKDNPFVNFVVPSSPDEEDSITEFKLAILGDISGSMNQRTTPPASVVVKRFNGIAWVIVAVEDYDVVYEGGYYYVYCIPATPSKLGDKFKVSFEM